MEICSRYTLLFSLIPHPAEGCDPNLFPVQIQDFTTPSFLPPMWSLCPEGCPPGLPPDSSVTFNCGQVSLCRELLSRSLLLSSELTPHLLHASVEAVSHRTALLGLVLCPALCSDLKRLRPESSLIGIQILFLEINKSTKTSETLYGY